MRSGGSLMCLQDISLRSRNNVTRCLFDGGSQGTLVKDSFARKHGFPYEEASYTLGGMGGGTVTYTPSNGGRIYTVPFKCNDGTMVSFKAFAVKDILGGNVGRDQM